MLCHCSLYELGLLQIQVMGRGETSLKVYSLVSNILLIKERRASRSTGEIEDEHPNTLMTYNRSITDEMKNGDTSSPNRIEEEGAPTYSPLNAYFEDPSVVLPQYVKEVEMDRSDF